MSSSSRGALFWAVAAHALVAAALAVSRGHEQPVADLLVFASVPALGTALVATRARTPSWPSSSVLVWVWSVALASTLAAALLTPGIYIEASAPRLPFLAMSLGAVAIVGSYALDLRSGAPAPAPAWLSLLARGRPAAMIALAFGLGAWMIAASPAPRIDVWQLDQQAAAALLHGRPVYAHGALGAVDSFTHARTIDAYDYPPLTLFLSTAAFAVTRETRWAQLAAILAGGVLLRLLARRTQRTTEQATLGDLLMACLLFHPRGLFVLEQAWGEPLALPFLGAFALAATARRWRLAAVMLGLLCALKQHFLMYLPALALVPGIGVPGVAIALGTLVATYAPYALSTASLRDLWTNLVVHHLGNPFRPDSLSLPGMLASAGIALPAGLGFASAAASLGVLRWIPRALGPLLLASSLSFLLFYVLGRQAFCNYYYLLGPTWLFAAATLARPAPAAEVT